MNKTLDIPPVEEKPKRKTATRRTIKKKVTATETVTTPAPVNAVPIPALTDTTSEIYICFEDTGEEIFSDIGGGFTVGKRLAMAYAKVTRTANSFAGISNPLEAFVITKAVRNGPHVKIFVRLKETAEVMRFPAADEKFVAKIPDRPVLDQDRNFGHEVSAINYDLLSRMSRYGDCPHCGSFVGSNELAYHETTAGKQAIATCDSCGMTMRAYYS